MHRHRNRNPSALIGLLTLLALAALACGSGEPAPAPPPDDASGAAVDSSAASESEPQSEAVPEEATTARTGDDESVAGAESAAVSETGPQSEAAPEEARTARTGDGILAPELVGITGWINSDPFTLESLRGKVVLLDIWTYTCINCIRTFPYVRAWHERYADRGLVVLGLHAPEFEFEKETQNVVFAALKHDLRYPIAQDNDMATWRALENNAWPAKYLVDKDGYIRYTHFGEGRYAETEQEIRELIEETGVSLADIPPDLEPERTIDPLARLSSDVMKHQTRELYAGFGRNFSTLQRGGAPYVRHLEFYEEPNVELEYTDPKDHLNHHLYIHGLWRNGLESLTHARETESYEDYLAIMFYARTVNVVMSLEEGEPYEVRVTMDGQPIKPEHAGADIEFDEEGNSFVLVGQSDMYGLVELPEFGGHLLKISSNSSSFSVFAYTFGSYLDRPGS